MLRIDAPFVTTWKQTIWDGVDWQSSRFKFYPAQQVCFKKGRNWNVITSAETDQSLLLHFSAADHHCLR